MITFTGVVRKIDSFGRFTIPKKLIKNLGFSEELTGEVVNFAGERALRISDDGQGYLDIKRDTCSRISLKKNSKQRLGITPKGMATYLFNDADKSILVTFESI